MASSINCSFIEFSHPCALLFQIFYIQLEKFFYRSIPRPVKCSLEATPLPPDPVDATAIVLIESELTEESLLSVRLEWTTPELTYGTVVGFEYRITTEEIFPANADVDELQMVLPEQEIEVQWNPPNVDTFGT